jgi:Lrp/AsnC family transcriptional regulator, regulator for asnA, asnC and gidA
MKIINENFVLDRIDRTILRALMKDARTPVLEIGRQVGVSGAAIHQRLKKLEQHQLLTGSRYLVNTDMLGYRTAAFVGLVLEKAANNCDIIKEISKIPEVLECHYITGNWGILVKVMCHDNDELMKVLYERIQTISGVSRTETFISLDQQIERQVAV